MSNDELIARLEAATGPDRELDLRVKAAVYGGAVLRSPFNGEWCLYREGTTDPRTGKTFERPSRVDHPTWVNDRYTASIDAALTLVPEGWFFDIRIRPQSLIDQHSPFLKMGEVSFTHPDGELGVWRRVQAATPALAICIAAIRAKREG